MISFKLSAICESNKIKGTTTMMMNIESDKKGKKLLFMVFKRFSQLQSDRYYKVIFLCKTYKKGFFKLHKKIIKNIFS